MKKINNKGFTLIELLVTILVISLILGLSTFGIVSAINSSKKQAVTLSLKSVKEGARTYSNEKSEDYWKEGKDNTYFCVTIEELINKGILNKNAKNIEDGVSLENYVVVVKDKVTKVVKKELLLNSNSTNDSNYNEAYSLCTGNIKLEEITSNTKIKENKPYTDTITINFEDATFKKDDEKIAVKERNCYYGKDTSNITNSSNTKIENNNCIIEDLEQNQDYYVKICVTSESNSTSCSDPNNIKTLEISKPSIEVDKNTSVKITYNDDNIYNKEETSYYFKSSSNGKVDNNVSDCTLDKDNNKYTCNNSTTKEITKDKWYKIPNKEITEIIITYEDAGNIKINAETRDKSNNSSSNEKEFSLYKITFNKGNADSINNQTNNIEEMCLAEKNKKCSITSPSIEKANYNIVGWNTNSDATSSSWNVNTKKDISKTDTYYPILSYTIKYNANGGSGAPSSQTGIYGKEIIISSSSPSRSGYVFAYWKDSNGNIYYPSDIYTANVSTTLTAQWESTIKITFSSNGSGIVLDNTSSNCTSSSDNFTVTCTCTYLGSNGCSMTAPKVRDGSSSNKTPYYFSSSASDKSSLTTSHWIGGATKKGVKSSDSKTMYLVYDKKEITFKSNIAGGPSDIVKNCMSDCKNNSCKIEAPALSLSGYEFLGWSTTSGSNNSVNACTDGYCSTNSSSTTYYGVWKKIESTGTVTPKKVTITFSSNGTGLKLTDTNGNNSTTELKVSCEYTGNTGCKITTPEIEGKYFYYSSNASDISYYNSSKHWWENATTAYLTSDATWYVVSKKVTVTETFIVDKSKLTDSSLSSLFGMLDTSNNKKDNLSLSCTYDIGTIAGENYRGCNITAPNTYGPNSGTTSGQYKLWNPFYYSTSKDDVSGFTSDTHWERNKTKWVSENKTWYLVYEEKIRYYNTSNTSNEKIAKTIITVNNKTYNNWYQTSCIAAGTEYACRIDVPTFTLVERPDVYCYLTWIQSNGNYYEGACNAHYIYVKTTKLTLYPYIKRYCTVYLYSNSINGYVIDGGDGYAYNYTGKCGNVAISSSIDTKLRFTETNISNNYVHNGWSIGQNSTNMIYHYINSSHNGNSLYANWVLKGTDPNPPLTCSSKNDCPIQNGKSPSCKNAVCTYS